MSNIDRELIKWFDRLKQLNNNEPEIYKGERSMVVSIIEAIYKDQGWIK